MATIIYLLIVLKNGYYKSADHFFTTIFTFAIIDIAVELTMILIIMSQLR